MGSIASVLQWHCNSCSLINPTERSSCIRCGSPRACPTFTDGEKCEKNLDPEENWLSSFYENIEV